jgi:hypothetical protein
MKFNSERYPNLQVRRADGTYLVAEDGVFDASAKADQDLLKSLPADRGVVSAAAKKADE